MPPKLSSPLSRPPIISNSWCHALSAGSSPLRWWSHLLIATMLRLPAYCDCLRMPLHCWWFWVTNLGCTSIVEGGRRVRRVVGGRKAHAHKFPWQVFTSLTSFNWLDPFLLWKTTLIRGRYIMCSIIVDQYMFLWVASKRTIHILLVLRYTWKLSIIAERNYVAVGLFSARGIRPSHGFISWPNCTFGLSFPFY